jgi:predicted nucleic acid-binding protein
VKLLIDTCVLAELRLTHGSPVVKSFIAGLSPKTLFISVITIGEITKGIALLADGRKKRELNAWLIGLSDQFQDRILPVDQDTAEIWGELTATARRSGHAVPVADGLIAATAQRHGLHVATRNTGDFLKAGAMAVNPWLMPPGPVQ